MLRAYVVVQGDNFGSHPTRLKTCGQFGRVAAPGIVGVGDD